MSIMYKLIYYMMRFFWRQAMLLSGISRANAEDVCLDVWNCVETYVMYMTPCA